MVVVLIFFIPSSEIFISIVIQIDAIDAVHVLVVDIIAHTRHNSPSYITLIEIHNLVIRIFINRISQGPLALQHRCEDSFLVDDSYIEGLILFAVGIGFYDFMDQFLQCYSRCNTAVQFTRLDKGLYLNKELSGAFKGIWYRVGYGRV